MARSKGAGTLFKRNGTWYFKRTEDGKATIRSLGTKDKREAERILKDTVAIATTATKKADLLEAIADQRGLVSQAGKIAIADALNLFIKRYKPKKHRYYSIEISWRTFSEWIVSNHPAITSIGGITADIVRDFIHGQLSIKKESTASITESAVRQIINSLLGKESPLAGSKKAARLIPSKERKALTDEEIKAIMEAAGMDTEEAIAIQLGAASGARLGDVCSAKWQDINLESGLWAYTPEKTKRASKNKALAPLDMSMVDTLRSRRATGEYVFPTLQKQYESSPNAASSSMRRVFKSAGVSGDLIGFHSLRTTFATKAVQAGVPVSTLGRILCDAPATLLAFYAKVDTASIESARVTMDAAKGKVTDEAEAIRREIKSMLDRMDVEGLRKIKALATV